MRITFYTSSTETLAYLQTVNSVLEHNKDVDNGIKAYKALKELVETFEDRLSKLEADNRRNKVCR